MFKNLLMSCFTIVICPFFAGALPNTDIVFVGQIPNPTDFASANATFGNHLASVESIIRGGDLFIRYRNGKIRNLTRAAGFGNTGFQGADAIAVRDPAVSWDGKKVLFSMVIGSPAEQYRENQTYWQIFEISGLSESEVPVVEKIPFQPQNYNNISPIYGSDDTIFFTSDRPRNGARHLYPQRDEYESQPTNTGIWNLDPRSGSLRLLDHTPSGAFDPIIDSFGRIIYSRWDHLQRDQQADESDSLKPCNFKSEAALSSCELQPSEVFPEPRIRALITDKRTNPHDFNHFFPWMINPDGTAHETLNHIGRHELHGYFDRSFNDDDNLEEHYGGQGPAYQREIRNFLQVSEDPLNRGRYFGTDAPEFGTHASGQIISLQGEPTRNGDEMTLSYVTDRSTASPEEDAITGRHSGFFRDPLPLSDGSLLVAHTPNHLRDRNIGTVATPLSEYSFRLKPLVSNGTFLEAGDPITSGISAQVRYFTPDVEASYSGLLWELQPVEVHPRNRPIPSKSRVEDPEQSIFRSSGVDIEGFQRALAERELALIVMRNVTSRDKSDRQQPFNLRVPGGGVQSIKGSGSVYDISFLQIFQGDQIRGYGGSKSTEPGRRVIATHLHDGMSANPSLINAPPSSIQISPDGSVAALVPARRALTWQLTDPNGLPIVRERYWLTFQPGEIRVCGGCHGANTRDQLGRTPPTNSPQALTKLLAHLRSHPLPDSGTNSETPGQGQRFSLRIRGSKGNSLKPGELATFSVRIIPASSEHLNIRLSVNNRRCQHSVATFRTSAQGRRTIRRRVPATIRKLTHLSFALQLDSALVSSANIAISPRHGQHRALTTREFRSLCRNFENS